MHRLYFPFSGDDDAIYRWYMVPDFLKQPPHNSPGNLNYVKIPAVLLKNLGQPKLDTCYN